MDTSTIISRSCVVAARIGLTVLVTALSSCSAAPDRESSLEEATVAGTVKVRGKLLDGGELHFSAVNPNRRVDPRNVAIAKDGTYSAKIFIGRNLVTVTPRKPRNKKEGQEFFGVNSEEKSIDVKPGENTADLEFLP
jgi:hypothetical protein